MQYMNEVSKIKDRVMPYLNGDIIDIGCYDCKIIPSAFGVDGRKAEGVDLVTDNLYNIFFYDNRLFDVVFSSHCLEHLENDYGAIKAWSPLLKKGGYLILYLPDGKRYSNDDNMEHMRDYTYENFMFWFKRVWCGEGKDFKGNNLKSIYKLIESGQDPEEEDMYSFYLVAQKL